jgi:hypothetical protein
VSLASPNSNEEQFGGGSENRITMKYDNNAGNCPTVVKPKAVTFHFHTFVSRLINI